MPLTDTRPLAVVTGASSGIGLELARQFADNGFDLIVAAEDAELQTAAAETEFFERADMLDTKVGASDKDDPADVAREGFEAMMAGKERVVSASMKTKAQGRGSRLLPDSVKAEMHRKMAEPGSGGDS